MKDKWHTFGIVVAILIQLILFASALCVLGAGIWVAAHFIQKYW